MTGLTGFSGARIFDGQAWRDDAVLLARDGEVEAIVPATDTPAGADRVDLGGGMLVPGFVDLQVNGGGGVMFNDRQDVAAIRTICAAHAPFGTTALLPTLITDTPEVTEAAIAAGADAAREKVPGFLGLHIEGPHLALSRKGAHAANLIRPMEKEDAARLVAARKALPNLLVTLAPEIVPAELVARLADAGITVSLGHSEATFDEADAAARAGARLVTHLFNAMSQMTPREPGLVGAALATGALSAGLIADGIHVDSANIAIALRAKQGPGKIFLVTDAMATLGTEDASFMLNGREIRRQNGRLTLADGTLAGADLDMISAVRFMHRRIGLPLEEALRMASLYPAQALGVADRHGRLAAGALANMVHLTDALAITGVWIEGNRVSG